MIIDTHLHFGSIIQFNMTENTLIDSMNKYNIDFGIISNIESCEFNSKLEDINNDIKQELVNNKTIDLIKKYPDRLKGLFWIKPHKELLTNEVEAYILDNRDYFIGIKIHPFHSKLRLTDPLYEPYLDFCAKHNLVIEVHTANDEYSQPKYVYETALKYPTINFIMVHMNLGGDNMEAITLINKLDNLYGDTTWVKFENVLKAIEICGSNKVLFGTDGPIDGVDTYKFYEKHLECSNYPTKTDFDNVMYKNALRLFRLK